MSNPQNAVNPSVEYFQVGIALQGPTGKFLLIKEVDISQSDSIGKDAAQDTGGKWKLPYDCLHEQDDLPSHLPSAASVIGTQLSAYDFDTHGICYIGLHEGPCVVIIYSADQPYDLSMTDDPNPKKVAAVAWFTPDEVLQLSKEGLLRNPEITMTAIENVQRGLIIPPEIITIESS